MFGRETFRLAVRLRPCFLGQWMLRFGLHLFSPATGLSVLPFASSAFG